MTFKSKQEKKEYQRDWIKEKRVNFLKDKKCSKCDEAAEMIFGLKRQGMKFSWSLSKEKLDNLIKSENLLCEKHFNEEHKTHQRKKATKHGHSHYTKTYTSWSDMKLRCLNPNRDNYQWYGGRGIKICERWLISFEHFLADMGERPAGMTLDRIDPEKNYSPENCRWATALTQGRNKRKRK